MNRFITRFWLIVFVLDAAFCAVFSPFVAWCMHQRLVEAGIPNHGALGWLAIAIWILWGPIAFWMSLRTLRRGWNQPAY